MRISPVAAPQAEFGFRILKWREKKISISSFAFGCAKFIVILFGKSSLFFLPFPPALTPQALEFAESVFLRFAISAFRSPSPAENAFCTFSDL